MNVKFIGQGYNSEIVSSVAQSLLAAFDQEKFHTFKCLVAFASFAGVSGLTNGLQKNKSHLKNMRIVVGVDQNATSIEALEEIIQWNVDSYIYYSSSRNIFHPKIYLFEGDDAVLIIIGSNNLTQMGLVQNIEGAVEIEFNKSEEDAPSLLTQINSYFEPLLSQESANLMPLDSNLVEQLASYGIISTEAVRRQLFAKNVGEAESKEALDRSMIKNIFPSTALQKLPTGFNPTKRRSASFGFAEPAQELTEAPVQLIPSSWAFDDTSEMLVVEIGGPSRWKQISFAKSNFETFFELPTAVGTNGQVNLKYLQNDGNVENSVENSISARVKASRNFNLEPLKVRQASNNYNVNNRPIIFFIKSSSTNFVYHFLTAGTNRYSEVSNFLPASTGLRRKTTTLGEFKAACPTFNF